MRLAAGLTFRNVRGPIKPRAIAVAALCAMSVLLSVVPMGCESTAEARRRHCFPRVGMSADQLVVCRCFQAGSGAHYMLSTVDTRTLKDPVSISIVSYICTLGEAGLARVSVQNGVVTQVFY